MHVDVTFAQTVGAKIASEIDLIDTDHPETVLNKLIETHYLPGSLFVPPRVMLYRIELEQVAIATTYVRLINGFGWICHRKRSLSRSGRVINE